MNKLEKYKGDKTYMFPNAALATPEAVLAEFPAALAFTHVIETDQNGEVCFAVMNLSALRSMHQIDPSLTEDEAIAEIEILTNQAQNPEPVVSAEERIAAALEFGNLLAM